MKYIPLIFLLLCSCISKTEIATDLLLIADFAQTRQIANNPDKYYEKNIILGRHPSEGRVNSYFAAYIIGNTIMHKMLPKKYLPYYQGGLIATQVKAVRDNYSIGLEVKF